MTWRVNRFYPVPLTVSPRPLPSRNIRKKILSRGRAIMTKAMIRIILSSKSSPEIEFRPGPVGSAAVIFCVTFLVGVFHSFTTKGSPHSRDVWFYNQSLKDIISIVKKVKVEGSIVREKLNVRVSRVQSKLFFLVFFCRREGAPNELQRRRNV